ncbi:MAG: glutamine synthetase [Solirubrobacterales bacterium]|nr:glutamine synthetase [Solirubrobacterales bacterium]
MTENQRQDPDSLVVVAQGDLVGLSRGKAVPMSRFERAVEDGIGWVPANLTLNVFDGIAPNPWGATGGFTLRPERENLLRVERPGEGAPPLQIVFSDLTWPDGSPWECCPRTLLKDSLAELKERTGLGVIASFEHEFQLDEETSSPHHDAFSTRAHAAAEPFLSDLSRVLSGAGLDPELVFSEFGNRQFEVPIGPAPGVVAADRGLLLRELVREVAIWHGRRATFTPVREPGGIGNGVHVHVSLVDEKGDTVMGGLRDSGPSVSRAFIAGIVEHAAALSAVTAASPVSYLRLVPGHWSAGYTACGQDNREVMVRYIPGGASGGTAHFEYRACDGTASPYLTLAALIRAGLDGIERELDEIPWIDEDPSLLDAETLEARGIGTLPDSLENALAALRDDRVVLPENDLKTCFLNVKQQEIDAAAEQDIAATCELYGRVY